MHELSVCQSLLDQALRIARDNGASRIVRIVVSVGPLSGVEAPLLARAFDIARLAVGQGDAELEIEQPPVTVSCTECGAEGAALPNRLICPDCGSWRVRVTSGSELLFRSIELDRDDAADDQNLNGSPAAMQEESNRCATPVAAL